MANLVKILQKEYNKGNTLIRKDGEIVSRERLENSLRKAYVSALKNGEFDFNVSYPEYAIEEISKLFIDLNQFIDTLVDIGLIVIEKPELPEPAECCDNVG